MHDQQLLDRLSRDGALRMICRIAERVEHHHAVGHRRIDRAEAVLAVEPLADQGDRAVDGALARALREKRLGGAQHIVDGAEEPEPRRLLLRRLRRGPSVCGGSRNSSSMRDALRIARARLLRHQHQQRHDHGAAPVRDLVEMERKPARQQHDLDRHHRHRAPRHDAVQREQDAGEDVAALGAAAARIASRARRMWSASRIVADHLQREIGFHGRAHVEVAVVEQRPAAMRALDAAQIGGDLGFERGVDRLGEIMPQQHVFGRNGGVGLELEHPMAVGALAREQRLRRRIDMPVEIEFAHGRFIHAAMRQRALGNEIGGAIAGADRAFDGGGQAGSGPIAGEHEIAPRGFGARAFCILRRRRGKSGAPLAHDLPGRQRGRQSGHARDVGPDGLRQFFARRVDQPVGGADRDRHPAGKGEQPFHRAVDDAEDRRLPGRRIDAEMRIDDGAEFGRHVEAADSDAARIGRHRKDDGIVGGKRDRLAAEIERVDAFRPEADGAKLMPEPHVGAASLQRASAGSISVAPSPSRAISGRQARPPAASVSRITAAASFAEPRGGSMLSAASSSGSTSR